MIFKRSALFLVLLSVSINVGCSDSIDNAARASLPAVEVEIETVDLSVVPVQIELAGTLQAVEHATIAPRVAGQVVRLPVRVGSKVEKGDLLVKISTEEVNAQVQQAEVHLKQTQRNLERESKLLEVNASTRERVKTLKELAQISEAALREAQTVLGYSEIKAPFAGTITEKLVEVGDLASPGTALLKLESEKTFEVVIQVPEGQANAINLASRLPLTVPAAKLMLEAEVREISPTVDPASRTTQVKLVLPFARDLRSGQFARVALTDNRAKTLMISNKALRQNGQMQQVFVAEQDFARMRLVRTGAEFDGRVEILSGLQPGDQVVVEAREKLQDGQPLKVLESVSAQ